MNLISAVEEQNLRIMPVAREESTASATVFNCEERRSMESIDTHDIFNDSLHSSRSALSDPVAEIVQSVVKEDLEDNFQLFKEFTESNPFESVSTVSSSTGILDAWEPLPYASMAATRAAGIGKARRRSSMPTTTNNYSLGSSAFPAGQEQNSGASIAVPEISFGMVTDKIFNRTEATKLYQSQQQELDTSLHLEDLPQTRIQMNSKMTAPRRRVQRRGSMPTISSTSTSFVHTVPPPVPFIQHDKDTISFPIPHAPKSASIIHNNPHFVHKKRAVLRSCSMPMSQTFHLDNGNGKRERDSLREMIAADPYTGMQSVGPSPHSSVVSMDYTDMKIQTTRGYSNDYGITPDPANHISPWRLLPSMTSSGDVIPIQGQQDYPHQEQPQESTKFKRRFSMPNVHMCEKAIQGLPCAADNHCPPLHSHDACNPTGGLDLRPETIGSSSATNSTTSGLAFVRLVQPTNLPEELPVDFFPSEHDVICGRGKQYQNHSGNKKFKLMIDDNLAQYQIANTKPEKSGVVISIVEQIRNNCKPYGGFVDKDAETGVWFEIGDTQAREKVGHALRFHIAAAKKKAKLEATNLQKLQPGGARPLLGDAMAKHQEKIKAYSRTIAEDAGDDNFSNFVLDTFGNKTM